MPSRFTFDRELLIRIFFFGTFAFLLTQVFLLARPFLPSILLAVIIAMMFFPIYRRLRRWTQRPGLAALIATLLVLLAALLPLIGFMWLLVKESTNIIPVARQVLSQLYNGDLSVYIAKTPVSLQPAVYKSLDILSRLNIDIQDLVLQNAQDIGANISAAGAFAARNAIIVFFKILILVLSLFFVFRDGEKILEWVLRLVPMETDHKQAIAKSAYETFWAVTIGVFLTAAAQGLTAMIGFFIAGVRMPVLLGVVTGLVSLLGASFVVCIPVAIFTMMESSGRGFFLLIWGAVLVGWLDNLLKPVLIGSRARMPFVLVFFSILGGIKMYGPVGLILGPVLVACVLAFIRIYRETYGA